MHLYTVMLLFILFPSQSVVLLLTGFVTRMWQYEITTLLVLLVQPVSCNKCFTLGVLIKTYHGSCAVSAMYTYQDALISLVKVPLK